MDGLTAILIDRLDLYILQKGQRHRVNRRGIIVAPIEKDVLQTAYSRVFDIVHPLCYYISVNTYFINLS
jgi:hypothetical protein